jgi:glutathione-independent formaldehyde dehydrogenase
MKAIVYNGPRDVAVKDMPDPTIQHPSDVIVRITTTNICGSDLHMYEGRTNLEPGKIIGHENLGEIVECGPCRAASGVSARAVRRFRLMSWRARAGWPSISASSGPRVCGWAGANQRQEL